MKICNAIFLALLLIASLAATAQETADVGDLKISGVELGMSAEEVIKGLAEYYSISPSEFVVTTSPYAMPITGYKNAVDEIVFKDSNLGIVVTMDINIDEKDAGYMAVSWLQIVDYRPGSEEATMQGAIDQNGEHSFINKRGEENEADWGYIWCVKMHESGKGCTGGTRLVVRRSTIDLQTSFFEKKFEKDHMEFMKK